MNFAFLRSCYYAVIAEDYQIQVSLIKVLLYKGLLFLELLDSLPLFYIVMQFCLYK